MNDAATRKLLRMWNAESEELNQAKRRADERVNEVLRLAEQKYEREQASKNGNRKRSNNRA